MIGRDHDASGSAGQLPVDARLALVCCRGAVLEVDRVYAEEHDIQVDLGKAGVGQRADELVGLRTGDPADDDDLDVSMHGELGSDIEALVTTVTTGWSPATARSDRCTGARATSVEVVPPLSPTI